MFVVKSFTISIMLDEYTAVGILGILLFSFILGIAVYLFWQEMGESASLTKQLFLTMLVIMSLMEMPRCRDTMLLL